MRSFIDDTEVRAVVKDMAGVCIVVRNPNDRARVGRWIVKSKMFSKVTQKSFDGGQEPNPERKASSAYIAEHFVDMLAGFLHGLGIKVLGGGR